MPVEFRPLDTSQAVLPVYFDPAGPAQAQTIDHIRI